MSFRPLARAVAATLAAFAVGCASLGGAPQEDPAGDRIELDALPADAPPEFDFLVARQLELAGRTDEALALYARALEKDPESAYLERRYAELAARSGRLEESLTHAERALELAPEDIDVRVFLGTLHRVRKDVEGAEAALRDDDGDPLTPEAAMLLFSVYLEAERFDDALAMATWMVADDPTSLRGAFALAGAYERLGKLEEVEGVLRGALANHPGNIAIYGALARVRREAGDREGEIAVYREVLKERPDHHQTLVQLAEAQLAAGKEVEARKTLRSVEERFPNDLRSTIRLALLDFEAQRYGEAAERFERAFASNPSQYELSYFLGLVYQRAGDATAALSAFDRVPAEHERYGQARTQVAALREDRGDYAGALAAVEEARAAQASRPLDLYRASLLAKTGDFDGAVSFIEDLLAENPQDDELLYNLGVLYGERRLYEDAIRYMRSAIEHNPDNASALNYIGYTFAEQGRNLDEAEALIKRALELRPDDGFITDSLGWVFYMRAQPLLESGDLERGRALLERALRELERAHELTGGDPVISEHMGDVYLKLDQKERALELFEQAFDQEPREGEQPDLVRKLEALRLELRSH